MGMEIIIGIMVAIALIAVMSLPFAILRDKYIERGYYYDC